MIPPYGVRLKITRESFAALAATFASLAYFFPVVRGTLILSPDEGVIFNVPLRVAAARMVLDGYLPLWNPYLFSGMPLFASAQAGQLFPLNWSYFFFSAQHAATMMTLLAYLVAGLGAYLYARRSGASIAGAAVTSLVWQWSGFMIAHIGHVNAIHTAALLPWLLWAADRYATQGGRGRGALLAALVAMQTFAGHHQTQVFALLLVGVYATVMSRGPQEQAVRRRYLLSLIFLVVGLLLASVQILPTLELMRNSIRASATYDFFSSFSLQPRMLTLFLAPYLFGGGDGALFRAPYTGQAFYSEYIGYVGLMPLMLAPLAPALKRDRRTIFWTIVALAGLALAVGRFLPLDVYKLVYQVPVLNLFRAPARHLMEVDFALAVLAGRGVTFLQQVRDRAKAGRLSLIAGASVAALTGLAVTVFRPAEFRLGRAAAVSFLRAPELFLPVVTALMAAGALWYYAHYYERHRARSLVLLFAVLIFDLCLWGQASGWRLSPTPAHPMWREPESVRLLREQQRTGGDEPARIFTEVQPFFVNTGRDEEEKYKLGEFMMSLQPDTYMMHRVENASGYDGFGLRRYSSLAGDMKIWGELTDPDRSLYGPGREFDILNVRYLLKQSAAGEALRNTKVAGPSAPAQQTELAPETVNLNGYPFATVDLGVPSLKPGQRVVFAVKPTDAKLIAIVTSTSFSVDVKNDEEVAHVRLHTEDKQRFEFELRAGKHTSEWAHDRRDLRTRIRHARAPVATTFKVEDTSGSFEGHTYLATFTLPKRVKIVGGEIEVTRPPGAPNLTLDVKRVSLIADDHAEPLSRESITKSPATKGEVESEAAKGSNDEARWRPVSQTEYLVIYQNTQALPRAWIAGEAVVLSDEAALKTIRTGRLPDGRTWDPRATALLDSKLQTSLAAPGEAGAAKITRYEPNRIDLSVWTKSRSILVLSENYYPGWGATVDGQAVETLRVDYNLRGVLLAPGEHSVRFVYRPKSVLIGLLISLLTGVCLFAWCLGTFKRVFVGRRHGRRQKAPVVINEPLT